MISMNDWIDVSSEHYGNKNGASSEGGAWVFKMPDDSWFGISFYDRVGSEIDLEDLQTSEDEKFPNDNKQFCCSVAYRSSKRLFHWESLQDCIDHMRSLEHMKNIIIGIDAITDVNLRQAHFAAEEMFSFGAGLELEWFYSNNPVICGVKAFEYVNMMINDKQAFQQKLEAMSRLRY